MKFEGRWGSGPGPASARSGRRSNSCSNITRSSSRASWFPRQKCAPKPKARWGLAARAESKVPEWSNTDSSRLAKGYSSMTSAPAGIRSPRSSTSRAVVRTMSLIGVTQRSISSTATGIRPGSASRRSPWAGGARTAGIPPEGDEGRGGPPPADEDQQRLVDEGELVEPVAIDLGVHEDAGQVAVRAGPAPVGQHALHVARVLGKGLGRGLEAGRVGGALRPEHVLGPSQQVGAVFTGHAEHVADHVEWQRGGDVPDEVAPPAPAHLVDDLV